MAYEASQTQGFSPNSEPTLPDYFYGSSHLPEHDPVNVGLLIASRFGLPKLLKLELEMGANVNLVSGASKLTPLMWAAMSSNAASVKLLLQYGADLHLASRSGNIPLTYAIANGHTETVKLLMDDAPVLDQLTEELSMDVSLSTACDTCGAAETIYKVSVVNTS